MKRNVLPDPKNFGTATDLFLSVPSKSLDLSSDSLKNETSYHRTTFKDWSLRIRSSSRIGSRICVGISYLCLFLLSCSTIAMLYNSIVTKPTDPGYIPLATVMIFFFYNTLVISIALVSAPKQSWIDEFETRWLSIGLHNESYVINYLEHKKKIISKVIFTLLLTTLLIIPMVCLQAYLSGTLYGLSTIYQLLQHVITQISSSFLLSVIYQLLLSCSFIHSALDFISFKLSFHPNNVEFGASNFKHYRVIHSKIIDLILWLNRLWQRFLLVYYPIAVSLTIVVLYNFIYLSKSVIGTILIMIYSLYNLIHFSSITWHVVMINGKAFSAYNSVYRMTLSTRSEVFRMEAELFLNRIAQHDIGFTLGGLFPITPNIVLTILAAITTLVVALPAFSSCSGPR